MELDRTLIRNYTGFLTQKSGNWLQRAISIVMRYNKKIFYTVIHDQRVFNIGGQKRSIVIFNDERGHLKLLKCLLL